MRHILSFGGGVNSVALMILLVREASPLDEVVFSDTGSELPETYQYLDTTRDFLGRHGIPFTVVSKTSGVSLYDTCWQRRVIPSAVWRWSTRDFKVTPIHRYYRSFKTPIAQYLGIAYDEIERMKDSRVDYVENVFPLVDRRITRAGCVQIISSEGLPIPEKSGCFFCPFNSGERWKWLHKTHPDLYDRAVALEENSKHFPSQRLTDQVFRSRDTVTLREFATRMKAGDVPELAVTEVPCGGECMT